jgi:hypothetical protein
MRLRRVSHVIVSSVLASCGGGETHPVVASQSVTIPSVSAAPSASASAVSSATPQAQDGRDGAIDVVPTDATARLRFVSLAEIVDALAPPDANRAALYAAAGLSHVSPHGLQRVNGPAVEDACDGGALQGQCGIGAAGFLSIAKDGTVTRGTLADLDASRTRDPIITRALAEISKARAGGVWFVNGVPTEFPAAHVLTDQTHVAPADAIPSLANVRPQMQRLSQLHGDARERAILALGVSARERAAVRAGFVETSGMAGRMTPLARGWLVEMLLPAHGSCGGTMGYARIVVLGSNVIVDVLEPGQAHGCRGRRPPGWDVRASRATSSVKRFFEDAASLEAASVGAFALVARELESFGAPRELTRRARAAARDEVRHAELMSRRAGVTNASSAPPLETRTPFEAALDNAVEGCVNESFAAVVARFQSRASSDEDLAREFAAIADDECAHGDLAHDIAAWLEPRLTPDERERVSSARERAKRLLVARAFDAAGGVDDARARETLGLPTRAQAAALAKAFALST